MRINIFQASKLISKQKVISLGLFNDNKSKIQSNYIKLFNKIISKEITNDEDAQAFLKIKSKSTYQKFKDRYTNKVLNYLLLSNTRSIINDYRNEQYYELLRKYSSGRIFHFNQQKKNAVEVYKYVYKNSKRLDIIELQLLTLSHLKQHYAFIEPDRKLFQKYTQLHNEARAYQNRYLDLEHLYDTVSHENIFSPPSQAEDLNKRTLEIVEKIYHDIREDDSFYYKIKAYEIATYGYNLNNMFEKSLEVSKRAIELTEDDTIAISPKIMTVYKDILSTYLKLKDYNNAQVYLEKIDNLIQSKGHNYFRIKGLDFSLRAMQKNYDKLYSMTKEILELRSIRENKVHYEEWTIREAYVNVLVETRKITPEILISRSKRKFRLNRFINEVEFYAKDKRGTNISIHVVQLIHFLIRKEYDKVLQKLDTLNQYTFRYLRNDETLRSNCFIKMLLKLPEAEYHPLRTRRYVARYAQKLNDNPFEVSMKEMGVEIIPYEQLWEIVIETLGENMKKKKT